MSSRLSDWQNIDEQRDCNLFRDCQDWQETDSLDGKWMMDDWIRPRNEITSCIQEKFSREFCAYTADNEEIL